MEKYFRPGQVTDDNMVHAHCILENYGCKYTLRLCNTYYFTTAKMVACKHLNVSL
jgi:hypothetical protein